MERRLQAAVDAGTPALIVRAGDFFGPKTTGNSYFSAVMVQPGAPVRRIVDPARRGVSHAWAYLPDVGETMAQLMDRERAMRDFDVFHFAGHQLASGETADAIQNATGNPHCTSGRSLGH